MAPAPDRDASAFEELARRYSTLGWALARADGKRPLGRGWEKAEPARPEYAAGLWGRWGQRWNLGVVCGPSKLAVLDVDRDDADAAALELLGLEALPRTPIVRTGSGRLHLYYRDPGGLEKRARDNIEMRAGPHFCLAPPSVHPEANVVYEWLPGRAPWEVELAELPPAVIAYFAAERGGNGAGAAPPIGDVIPIGQIDTTLTSLGGSMRRRGMSEDAIRAALVAELARCEPGHSHTEKDCRRIAASAARYAPAEGSRNSIPPPIATESVAEPNPSEGGELPFAPLAATLEDVPPEPPWLVHGYLTPSAVTLLAGRPKVGKSTLVFALLAAIATGAEFVGLETASAGILLLTEERRDTLAAKARAVGLIRSATARLPKGGGIEFSPVHVLMRHDAGGPRGTRSSSRRSRTASSTS